jgi:hypothetical protein
MKVFFGLALVLAAVGAAGCASESSDAEGTGTTDDALTTSTRVTCESLDHHYESCPTQGIRVVSVRVLRQLSSAPCNQGQSFGNGENYIWVNFGCRAEFEVRVDMGGGGGQGRIRVLTATYGGNAGAWRGNATNHVARSCDGRPSCEYTIRTSNFGDPAPGWQKDFEVEYVCGNGSRPERKYVGPEANGQRVRLSCGGSPWPDPWPDPDPDPWPNPGCGTLEAGQSLFRDQGVRSCDGRTVFQHQSDGNVVLYHDGRRVAATDQFDSSTDRLTLEQDGNLVQTSRWGQRIWASDTPGHFGPRLVVRDDCDVQLLDSSGRAYWHTNTSGCFEH